MLYVPLYHVFGRSDHDTYPSVPDPRYISQIPDLADMFPGDSKFHVRTAFCVRQTPAKEKKKNRKSRMIRPQPFCSPLFLSQAMCLLSYCCGALVSNIRAPVHLVQQRQYIIPVSYMVCTYGTKSGHMIPVPVTSIVYEYVCTYMIQSIDVCSYFVLILYVAKCVGYTRRHPAYQASVLILHRINREMQALWSQNHFVRTHDEV